MRPEDVYNAFNNFLYADNNNNELITILNKDLQSSHLATKLTVSAQRCIPHQTPRLLINITVTQGGLNQSYNFLIAPHSYNDGNIQLAISQQEGREGEFLTRYPSFSIIDDDSQAVWRAGGHVFGRPYLCAKLFSEDGVNNDFRNYWPSGVLSANWEAPIPLKPVENNVDNDEDRPTLEFNGEFALNFFSVVGATLIFRRLAMLADQVNAAVLANADLNSWNGFLRCFSEQAFIPSPL